MDILRGIDDDTNGLHKEADGTNVDTNDKEHALSKDRNGGRQLRQQPHDDSMGPSRGDPLLTAVLHSRNADSWMLVAYGYQAELTPPDASEAFPVRDPMVVRHRISYRLLAWAGGCRWHFPLWNGCTNV